MATANRTPASRRHKSQPAKPKDTGAGRNGTTATTGLLSFRVMRLEAYATNRYLNVFYANSAHRVDDNGLIFVEDDKEDRRIGKVEDGLGWVKIDMGDRFFGWFIGKPEHIEALGEIEQRYRQCIADAEAMLKVGREGR